MPNHKPKNKHEIEVKLRVGDPAQLLRQLRRLGARPTSGRVHEMNVLYDTPRRDLFRRGEALRVRIERPAPPQAARRAPAKRTAHTETPREPSSRGGGSGEVVTLTHKERAGPAGPAGGGPSRAAAGAAARRYKVRTEDELRVPAAERPAKPLDAILRASGLVPSFRYEKYRQAFRLPGLPGLVIDLDETPLGVFVELEGPPPAIDRAAARLGYGPADYITKSYPALHAAARERRPHPRRKTGAKPRTSARARASRRPPADAMLFPRPQARSHRPPRRRTVPKRGQ